MSKSFGDGVPYGDPLWYSDGSYSPYYNDSHRAFRAKCRDFVENEVTPFVDEWEAKKSIPNEVNQKAAKLGLLPCIVGKNGYEVAGITPPENYDTFHELIFIDELARCCSGTYISCQCIQNY
jgi:alkylation response protein AidB-like acyl-CoA dehydrogenase